MPYPLNNVTPIVWTKDTLQLLDQRRLPSEETYLVYRHPGDVAQAISEMVVRGAPAIGIAAAYAAVLAAAQPGATRQTVEADLSTLAAARPTAVNLVWAITRMRDLMARLQGPPSQWIDALAAEAVAIHDEDAAACLAMGKIGAACLPNPVRVYTHCNAGALATGGQGTSLSVVRQAHRQGQLQQTFVGETRPWMQGSRLTAWELRREGIAVCLCTESAAATLFREGRVDWLLVGADRVTRCGDVANKVGTYPLSLLAKHHGVKVMVVAPLSTIDPSLHTGREIPIEQRPAREITHFADIPVAPEGCDAFNPSFDITPAALIDVLVTERGALRSPDETSIMKLLQTNRGG